MAAKGDVVITLHMRDADAARAWLKQARAAENYDDKIRKIGVTSKRTARGMQTGMNRAMSLLGKATAALFGIGTVLQGVATFSALVRREFQAIKNIQNQAGQKQLGFAAAFRRAAKMIGPEKGYGPEDLHRQISLAVTPGVTQEELMNQSISALSSRGNVTAREAVKTVIEVAKLAPEETVEGRRALTAATLEMKRIKPGGSDREYIGFLMSAISGARVESAELYAKNLTPALAAIQAIDPNVDMGYAASLVNAIGTRAVDPTGRTTRTGTINLLKQLKERGTVSGVWEAGMGIKEFIDVMAKAKRGTRAGKLRRELMGVFAGDMTAEEKREAQYSYQNSTDLRLKPGLSTRARNFIAFMELMTEGSETRNIQASLLERQTGIDAGAETFLQAVEAGIEAVQSAAMNTYEVERRLAMVADKQALADESGMAGAAAPHMRDILLRSGAFASEVAIEELLARFRASRTHGRARIADEMLTTLRWRQSLLSDQMATIPILGPAGATSETRETRQARLDLLLEQQQSVATAIYSLIDALEQRDSSDTPQPVEVVNQPAAEPSAAGLVSPN